MEETIVMDDSLMLPFECNSWTGDDHSHQTLSLNITFYLFYGIRASHKKREESSRVLCHARMP